MKDKYTRQVIINLILAPIIFYILSFFLPTLTIEGFPLYFSVVMVVTIIGVSLMKEEDDN